MTREPRRVPRLPWRSNRHIRDDFEEELSFHYDMRVDELLAAGHSPEAARELAAREFGDVDDARRYVRAVDTATEAASRRRDFVHEATHDLLHAFRRLRRAPLFTTTAVLTLALGIGACTLAFAIVSGVLLSPLPYKNPQQAVMIWGYVPQIDLGFPELPIHGRYLSIIRDNTKALESVAGFRAHAFNLGVSTAAERLDGVEGTGEFFDAIGVSPALGRFFSRENETPGSERVVVLSDELWRRRFGGQADIIGKVITLDAQPYTVIGVAPPGFAFPRGAELPADFQFPSRAELWVPLPPPTRGPSDLALVGRLRPGVSIAAAARDMDRIRAIEERLIPQGKGWFGTQIVPLHTQLVGKVEPMLFSLLAAVLVLLAIACVNTAQLQLAQLQRRRRELAVRAALGASSRRLVSALILEVLLVAAAAGVLGTALAAAALRVVRAYGSQELPRLAGVSIDARTVAVTLAATIAAGLLASLIPAAMIHRTPLSEALRRGAKGAGGGSSTRARRILIVAELTLSVVLVACGGLLMRSLSRQLRSATGFDAPNGLTFEVSLPPVAYPEKQLPTSMEHPAAVAFFDAALERIRAIPGIEAAAIGKPLPLSGAQESSAFAAENSAPPKSSSVSPVADFTVASSEMFRALGTPMLAGRDFTSSDRQGLLPVVIVNQSMARWLWGSEPAIGKRIKLGGVSSPAPWMTVIGVSADIKRYSLTQAARPEMIVPYTQNPYPTFSTMQFVVRSRRSSASLLPELQTAIAAVDPSIPVSRVRTIEDLVGEASANARFATRFMTALGAAALSLAMIGLYGVIAYGVGQRRQEFGVRRALGAAPGTIVALVVGEGVRLAMVGILVGGGLAVAAGHLLSSLLYQVTAFDVTTLGGTVVILSVAAIAACLAPAWRASHVEPRAALEDL